MITQPNTAVYPDGRTPTQNLDKFFLENRAAVQTFIVDPTRRTTLVGSRGTRLTIAPNIFLDSTGWPVRDAVVLFLREVFTKPQMILSGLTNTSEDRILGSAGQILLEASAEGHPLQLASPIAIDLPFPVLVDNPLAIQLFSGGVSKTSSFGSGLRFDWKIVRSKGIRLKTFGGKKYLNFSIDDLNWWNCTSFLQRRRNPIMMSVRCSTADLPVDDLAAFLVFRDFNTVVRMYPGRHGFSSWNIPRDLVVRTILIGISDEKILLGKSPWATTSSQPIHIEMEACGREDALSLIQEWSEL